MDHFQLAWRKFHPVSPPVGHALKWAETEHWLRFHSLPQSKRYAENEGEVTEILHRMTTLGDEVLGGGAQVLLILANPEPFPYEPKGIELVDLDVTDPEAAQGIREVNARWEKRIRELIDENGLKWSFTFPFPDDECDYQIFATTVTWRGDHYRSLLQHIADDQTDGFVWMSLKTGDIFAPYDGGVDLIVRDAPQRERLKREYAEWLPANGY
jgi:hypothetical protein